MFDNDVPRVQQLFLGNSNAFLVAIKNEIVLIDGGLGDCSDRILRAAATMVEHFSGIKYLLITHAHYDHVGSCLAIREKTGARIVAQKNECENLRQGKSPVPAGTMWLSRQISWLGCLIFRHCIRFSGFSPDIIVEDYLELELGGEPIRCFHLPGHTQGSLGIKIGGWFFAGDTVFHLLPNFLYPPFADDEIALNASLTKIASTDARLIMPGHGRPIPAAMLKRFLRSRQV